MFEEAEHKSAELLEQRLDETFREILAPDRFARWAQVRRARQREMEAQEAEIRARREAAAAAAKAAGK